MQLQTSQTVKYFDFDLPDTNGLLYPLYSVYPGEKEPQAAFLAIDMAWTNAFFLADCSEGSTSLQETDWNNRIMQFRISPLITQEDLEKLSKDAYFYALICRIYAGCTPTTGFKTCTYNDDAKLAVVAVTEYLQKIPTIIVTDHPRFYQELKMKSRLLTNVSSDAAEIEPGIHIQICPKNSHLIKSGELTFPHKAVSRWKI